MVNTLTTGYNPFIRMGLCRTTLVSCCIFKRKPAANICVNDTNKPEVYVGHRVYGGPNGCSTSSAKYVYKIQESNAGYTKTLHIPQTASQYTLQVQRKCANPTGALKPFPFAVNGGSSSSKAPYAPIPVQNINYTTPPKWYTEEK